MRYTFIIISLGLFFTFSVNAEDLDSCLEKANTQVEMNSCQGVNYQSADDELNRVYQLIRKVYKDDSEFLSKLKISQLAWIKLRDADLEMRFPSKDKRLSYGSAYRMCDSDISVQITLQRIEYLKQWLEGIEEGDVCSGSIKRPYQIQEAVRKI